MLQLVTNPSSTFCECFISIHVSNEYFSRFKIIIIKNMGNFTGKRGRKCFGCEVAPASGGCRVGFGSAEDAEPWGMITVAPPCPWLLRPRDSTCCPCPCLLRQRGFASCEVLPVPIWQPRCVPFCAVPWPWPCHAGGQSCVSAAWGRLQVAASFGGLWGRGGGRGSDSEALWGSVVCFHGFAVT